MFGIGMPEFLVIMIVAIIVIGPKDFPRFLYHLGKIFRKFKLLTADIQKSLNQIIEEEELDNITRTANQAGGEGLQANIEAQVISEEKRIING